MITNVLVILKLLNYLLAKPAYIITDIKNYNLVKDFEQTVVNITGGKFVRLKSKKMIMMINKTISYFSIKIDK